MTPNSRTALLALTLIVCSLNNFANTFTVVSNADNGPGTLREALTLAAANGTAVADQIVFLIPDNSFAGRIIDLQSELPPLSSNLVIDGSTQPSPVFGTTDARIFIRKLTHSAAFSVLKAYEVRDIKIYGLYLFFGDWQSIFNTIPRSDKLFGVDLRNAFNIEIGAPGKGNVINGMVHAIHADETSDSCRNIIVRSNYIGTNLFYQTNPATQDIDNVIIRTEACFSLLNVKDLTIGGPTPAEGNNITGARAIDMDSRYATGNGFILIQNNHFARMYDNQTLQVFSDFWNPHIHVGRSRYLNNWWQTYTIDYQIQVLDNDIPTHLGFNYVSGYFTLQGNHFDDDNRYSNGPEYKAAFYVCTAGGLIGSEDPARINYFRYKKYNNWFPSVVNSGCGPVTNIKNVYDCNSLYGSTTTVYPPYNANAVFAQIGQTTATAVSGTATPQCRIDLYYDDQCTACEGKIYIGKTTSDAAGNWQYNGSINGTVIATATDATGRTSEFSAPRFYYSNAKVVQPTCGLNNGSITGISSDGAESYYWVNLRTSATVANTIDLTGVGPGEYLLYGVHGGTCIKSVSQSYDLQDETPKITNIGYTTQPSCGKFNGYINSVYVSGISHSKIYWINEQRQVLGNQTNINGLGPGKYKLIVQDTITGCGDSTAFYVLVNQSGPNIDINQVQLNAASCKQANGSISGIQYSNITGTAHYLWLDSANRTAGSGPDLLNVPAGKYRLKFKDDGTCDTVTTPVFIVGSNGVLVFDTSSLAIGASQCQAATGNIKNITVQNGQIYTWKAMPTGAIMGHTTDLLNVAPGYYKLVATSAVGCTDSTRAFYVPQVVPPKLTAAPMTLHAEDCERRDASAAVTSLSAPAAGYSFAWKDSSTQQVVAGGLSMQGVAAGKYYFYATDNNGCTQLVDSVRLIDYPAPQVNDASAVVAPDVCTQQSGGVTLANIQGSSPFSYTWYTANGQPVSKNQQLTHVSSGSYYLVISDAHGCNDTSAVFSVHDTTVAMNTPLYDVVYVVKDRKAALAVKNPEQGVYELYALPGGAIDQQNGSGVFTTGPVGADTTVYVLFRKGTCSSVLTPVNIKVLTTLELLLPNAFTPNGDGHNDVFRLGNPGLVKTFYMTIYGRWGQKIFETADPYKGWDGTINGVRQDAGAYIWSIHYTDVLGSSKSKSGSVLVIR